MSTPPIDRRTRITRRRLLAGMSALSVALTSPIWRRATVFGQDARKPVAKRFIAIFSANGTIGSAFFPAGSARDAALGSLPPILAPLDAHKQRLLVLKGVHMNSTVEDELGKSGANKPGGPHMKGPGAMLTGGSLLPGSFTGAGGPAGWADRISVDQAIASRIGGDTPFPSLEFGVRIEGQEPLRVISYRGANQPNLAIDDPRKMYERIFANKQLSDAERARLTAERGSVLDFLKDDLGRLQRRVGGEDRARLEAHLDGVRNLEQRLHNASGSCEPIAMPGSLDSRAMANFPAVGKLQMDLLLLAFSCGMTRVATLMWANADSWQYFPWIGVDEEHHELSHAGDDDAAAREKLVKINVWHAEQVKYLLDGLAGAPDSDGGSLLDHTLVLWGNELGAGNSHSYTDIPWLLAGGAGDGLLRMGRSLQFQDRPHNDLLLTVCHALGLSDLTSFGIPGVCTGPLDLG